MGAGAKGRRLGGGGGEKQEEEEGRRMRMREGRRTERSWWTVTG